MKVTSIPCGPAANESELRAISHLVTCLKSTASEDEWILLTNLMFSVNHQLQSDEIDIVVIGPPGVKVLEVKHWNARFIDDRQDILEEEADRVTSKARKIGTTLRAHFRDLPRVEGAFFLTNETVDAKKAKDLQVRGVLFHLLRDWRATVGLEEPRVLSPDVVRKLGRTLEPKSVVALEGDLRRFGGLVNLDLISPKEERFHRVYKGTHAARKDRVVLHLYDLSASQEKNAEKRARREFDALHRLQLYKWAPRILDSFQEAAGYPGEMFFYTIVDPAAPTLEERTGDSSWKTLERADFARKAIRGLAELHTAREDQLAIVHRNIGPKTILVHHDGSPIFTGFDLSRIPSDTSVASAWKPPSELEKIVAPEIRMGGLAAADQRSDVYSLCAALSILFEGQQGEEARESLIALQGGVAQDPQDRKSLNELERSFAEVLGDSVPVSAPPSPRFWSEDQIVQFRDRDYRIVSRLGSGGVGVTFKVVEVDSQSKEELGTYVGKVAHSEESGRGILRAYSLVRSHLGRHQGLSAVYEVAKEWQENNFAALMSWIEGTPLFDFVGIFPLLAEDLQEPSAEALAIRWLRNLCEALDVLHSKGLVHGDVSPRNIIISGGGVVLTDYDFVTKIGEPVVSPGTMLYCPPQSPERRVASPSDDLYSLAAGFFHVVFDKDPFLYGGNRVKERGLNWEKLERDKFPVVASFLDRATSMDPSARFQTAGEAVAALQAHAGAEQKSQTPREGIAQPTGQPEPQPGTKMPDYPSETSEKRVEWLTSLLKSYPGSRWGNQETRGLDTPFAAQTYVDTGIEEALIRSIRARRVRLVILCGNAGDGKTALLQNLASRLGFGKRSSGERILERRLEGGLIVRMNLDGSAAWLGRSADEIIDEFLGPFLQGPPVKDIAHLLAINDGRLLEWIERVEGMSQDGSTPLTDELHALLQDEAHAPNSYIRFISMNQRSLVGGITQDRAAIETPFLEQLLDRLYGGDTAADIWKPCIACSACTRCEVFRALKVFGPSSILTKEPEDVRRRARGRLFEALQAVHLRGEVHITMRELRAALVFILFGLRSCGDYHDSLEIRSVPYWDLAFDPAAPGRQGEVLRELARFDPALEAHPQIDRHLLGEASVEDRKTAPRYGSPLKSARRRAYFEWTEDHLLEIAHDKESLGLARGRHLGLFRRIALDNQEMGAEKRAGICERLCRGISRLEDLPTQALDRFGAVPLRITPRTPTETAFWVEKPLSSFRLEADLSPAPEGLERLHRQAFLTYRYRDGREERLRLGAELFHLLLELSEGYQIGDVSSDDTFAHLSIFVQRLAREDERELLAWNPTREDVIFRVWSHISRSNERLWQKLSVNSLDSGESS